MPIYKKTNGKYKMLKSVPLIKEKILQNTIEENLMEMLEMHFLATEYGISPGRIIDTLAVDTTGAPVIIEYKRNKNDNVINQALSYLKWLLAQKVDFFEMLVQKKLGKEFAEKLTIDWKNPRVICVAEAYNKFDLDTVEVVPLRIELYKYINYENDTFLLEPLNVAENKPITKELAAGAGGETSTEEYTVESLLQNIPANVVSLFQDLRQRIIAIDDSIAEKVTRYYIAYRVAKNFAEVSFAKGHIKIHMRPVDFTDPKKMVDKIPDGYNWTLNKRIYLKTEDDLDYVVEIIEQSYKDVL